jgi:hypothetical protein
MENFETDLTELLEVESVKEGDILQEFECWDSLTVLSIIAWADDKHNIVLSAKEVNASFSIKGLKELIIAKKSGS